MHACEQSAAFRGFLRYSGLAIALTLVLGVPSLWADRRVPTLSISDVTVSETGCQTYTAVFTVSVSHLKGRHVTVQFATADGTAIAGTDYTAVMGTLRFDKNRDDDSDDEGSRDRDWKTITVPVATAAGPGPAKTFFVNLAGATNATIAKPQGVGSIQAPPAVLCDDGNSCDHSFCDAATATCKHVPLAACTTPGNEADCKLSTTCKAGDQDGDGLSDLWERAGGIDFNCDGVLTPDEMVLTNVDPVFPDGSPNPYPSADPYVKDVFVKYDWMELPDQLTNGQPTACTVNPLSAGPPNFLNLFYPNHSDQCAFDQACLGGFCRGHSDAPDPAALMIVIQAYAAHNIRLHLVKGHALPHSNVTTFGPPVADCTADLAPQSFSGTHAVDFYGLKATNFNASYNGQNFTLEQLVPFMHYAVFAHRHSCDSTQDCAKAACLNPDTGRNPLFNETGIAEQPGNDIIVSMGGFRDRNITPLILAQAGTFMHELGHNMGLNHGGPLFAAGVATDVNQVKLNYKPNYLSVMNYNHQSLGISTASSNCAAGDYLCKTTPVSVRIDYSSFANGVAPNTLDENNGTEAAGIALGNSDIGYTWCSGVQSPIPGTGPVDFNCNGIRTETWCASGCDITPGLELNKDPAGGGQIPNGTPGSGDVLLPYEDWPNLIFAFQCQPTFNDGAPGSVGGGDALSSNEITCDQMIAQAARESAATVPPPQIPTIEFRTRPTMGGYVLGREDAPVTIVEYGDYQCPYCKGFHQQTFAELKKNYIDTGKVRFVHRDFPLEFHAKALGAAEAARCGGEQGKFWEVRDQLLRSSALDRGAVSGIAQALGLNTKEFDACLDSGKYKAVIQQEIQDGKRAGVSGTPAFFINGIPLTGAQPISTFAAIIDRQLTASQKEAAPVSNAPNQQTARQK